MPIAIGDVNRDGWPHGIIVDQLKWQWPLRPMRLIDWAAREIGPGPVLVWHRCTPAPDRRAATAN